MPSARETPFTQTDPSLWKAGVTLSAEDGQKLGKTTLGRVPPSSEWWTVSRGAGFNGTQESNVQRVGYVNSFSAGGAWKDSSFANRGAASLRLCHPSLWVVGDVRDHGTLNRDQRVFTGDFTRTSLPGYRGFIPGKKSETVFGETFRVANAVSQEIRPPREGVAPRAVVPYLDEPQGLRSLRTIQSESDLRHSVVYGNRREELFALGHTAKTNMVKDHEIPPPMQRTFSTPQLCEAIPGYTGFVSGRVAEAAHLDWRKQQREHQCEAVPGTYGKAVAGWSKFVPGKVSETVHGSVGMANTFKSMQSRQYFQGYEADQPQYPAAASHLATVSPLAP